MAAQINVYLEQPSCLFFRTIHSCFFNTHTNDKVSTYEIQCMPFYMLLFAPRSFFFSQQSKWKETFHRSIVCWVRHPSPRWELCKERTHAKTPTMQVAPTRWMGVLGSMARDHASILKHTALQLVDSLNCRWKTCVDRYLNLEKWERSRKLRTMLVTATNCFIFQLMMLQEKFLFSIQEILVGRVWIMHYICGSCCFD